jgi:hypothetical protein
VTIEFVFQRIHPVTWAIERGDRLSSFQIGLFSCVEETRVSLQRKPPMLEAAASSTLFLCESWVSFWKECFLEDRVFRVEKFSFCSKYAYSAELKKSLYLSKESHLCYKLQRLAHCFHVRIELVFERNTSCISQFSLRRQSVFAPRRPIKLSWRNTRISPKKIIYVRCCHM